MGTVSLIGTCGDDTLAGTDGDDVLFGMSGNDVIFGGAGDDIMFGNNGNNVLSGGTGDDLLYGGTGSDTYKFGRGCGKDTIIETEKTENDIDIIELGEGLTANDILVSRDQNNLYISIYGTQENPEIQDVLTVKDYYIGEVNKVNELHFVDGTVWTDMDEHVTC